MLWSIGPVCDAPPAAIDPADGIFSAAARLIVAVRFRFVKAIAARSGSSAPPLGDLVQRERPLAPFFVLRPIGLVVWSGAKGARPMAAAL